MPQGLLSSELSPVSFRGKIPGFCREGNLGTHKGRTPCEDGGRDWGDRPTS
ncbi:CDGSH iron sulfur domain 2 [Homo sapiens]|uniref:CDGSH iron sulfur domain 2 n=1 Tax=Homo sapiens TaxID=9606 RepID=A0A2R8Y4Y3_HUMAN|nr:CDGSH iron sulfur domain 2 [Homo sapiens]KAI4026483.1 CDGSH iron sulfur domain 2 [Homo sapiens]